MERNRGKRANGHAGCAAVPGTARHNSNAARKKAAGGAKFRRCDRAALLTHRIAAGTHAISVQRLRFKSCGLFFAKLNSCLKVGVRDVWT